MADETTKDSTPASEDWRVQLSIKYGNNNLLNVRAATVGQLNDMVAELQESSAFLVGVTEEIQAIATIKQEFPTTQQVPESAPTPAGYGSDARLCAHGVAMTYRTGANKTTGKAWAAWFCGVKTDPRLPECKAQFVN